MSSAALRAGTVKRRGLEAVLLGTHLVAYAAALLIVGGLGYTSGVSSARRAEAARVSEAASDLRQNREEASRLSTEMKQVRAALDGLKGERDRSRGDLTRRV